MREIDLQGCVPETLHRYSQRVLDQYRAGKLQTHEFMRWFHMPNSTYLRYSYCIAMKVDPENARRYEWLHNYDGSP